MFFTSIPRVFRIVLLILSGHPWPLAARSWRQIGYPKCSEMSKLCAIYEVWDWHGFSSTVLELRRSGSMSHNQSFPETRAYSWNDRENHPSSVWLLVCTLLSIWVCSKRERCVNGRRPNKPKHCSSVRTIGTHTAWKAWRYRTLIGIIRIFGRSRHRTIVVLLVLFLWRREFE